MYGCWSVAPPALTLKRGQREVAGEFPEPDSQGTVFESAVTSWSSPLRGSFLRTLRSSMSVRARVWRNPLVASAASLLACPP